jgi:hypothetical protein
MNTVMNHTVRHRLAATICFAMLLLAMAIAPEVRAQVSAESAAVETVTPEELQYHTFPDQPEPDPPTIKELNVSQQYTMSRQRREFMALLARHLGVLSLKGSIEDLKVLQAVVDRNVIADDELYEWQTMGVVFGDLLASQFDLDWVSYEDDRGVSRALRFGKTDNFVFPVTLFSKRVRFNESIDVQAIYDALAMDIKAFKTPPVAPGSRSR